MKISKTEYNYPSNIFFMGFNKTYNASQMKLKLKI